jgi:5-methylcytosine-specific restriction endonuclease McrA
MTIPDARQLAHTEQQPRCARCRHRHLPGLPCWKGPYRDETTAMVLAVSSTCWICRGTATTADHITPRSLGGDDQLANLRPACRSCNSSRGTAPNPFTTEDPTPPAGVPLSPRWQH